MSRALRRGTARAGALLAAALATGTTVALDLSLLAPPAWADGSVTAPEAGTTVGEDGTVQLEAVVAGGSAATELRLVDPTRTTHLLASTAPSGADQTVSGVLDTSCPAYPGSPCVGRSPARNGGWTVQLAGGASDSRSFVLRVPPRAPAAVTASRAADGRVVVTWDRGAEPDLTGWSVLGPDGGERGRVAVADCAATCRTVVATAAASDATLRVRADRSTCPACDDVVSATSDPVPVAAGDDPSPVADPAGAPGSSSAPRRPGPTASGAARPGPTPGPSATPSLSAGTRPTFAPGAGGFAGFDNLALPTVPATGDAPEVAPLADGTYGRTLPFGPILQASPPVEPVQSLRRSVARTLDRPQLARSAAVGLLLLLVAAHLRRWLTSGHPSS